MPGRAPQDRELLSIAQCAARKGVSTATVRRRIQDGTLEAIRSLNGRIVRVSAESLDAAFISIGKEAAR